MASSDPTVPRPNIPLNGHCSVIYNIDGVDTLYTYQSNAFQSLPLQPGSSWQILDSGIAVNGAKCVLGRWDDQDALIVVGGTPISSTPKGYEGLQHYTFATNQWSSISSGAITVLQNRQGHNAAPLIISNSLLVYSGFQDNSFTESSETYTILTVPPYTTQSFPFGAPLALDPVLLSWNVSHAVMVGGSADNHAAWFFSQEDGWEKSKISVPSTITNMTAVTGATLNSGNDEKFLQLFDLQATPNTATTLSIQAADLLPTKRQLGLRDDLPAYNGTLSSSVERVGYSLTQSPSSGIVVASGGAGDAASPIIMFNQSSNTWISPENFFMKQSTGIGTSFPSNNITMPTSNSTMPTNNSTLPTSNSTLPTNNSTSTANNNGQSNNSLPSSGRLGIAVGGAVGGAFILAVIVFLFYYRLRNGKRIDEKRHPGRQPGVVVNCEPGVAVDHEPGVAMDSEIGVFMDSETGVAINH